MRVPPVAREALKTLLKKLPPSVVMRLPSTFVNRTYFSGLRAIALPPARRFFMISDPTSDALAAKGFYDHGGEALRCFLALLPRTRTFVDIGANTGVYGLLAMAEHVSAVHAFEPVPFILERLDANAALNGFPLRGRHAAVGAESGDITIYVPKGSMPTEASTRADFRPGSAGLLVPSTTLDDFCRSHRIDRIDLLKIDTESTEPDVLRGAAEVLRRHRPVILCEVLHGLTERALHDVMDAERYAFFSIRDDGLTKVDRIVGDSTYRFLNFLVVPVESEADVVRVVAKAFAAR